MTFRKILAEQQVSPRIQSVIGKFHPDAIETVERAITKNKVVVVGMKGNHFVKKAIRNLTKWGVAFEYVQFGSYFSHYDQRAALKAWTGFSTFPMIFVNGVLIGGNSDMEAEKADGAFDQRLRG
ncbi:MAG: hypothetical protein RLZZ488_351 [Pseudomonadota bacterium]